MYTIRCDLILTEAAECQRTIERWSNKPLHFVCKSVKCIGIQLTLFMIQHAKESTSYCTESLKLVGSYKKASLPLYTRRLSSILFNDCTCANGQEKAVSLLRRGLDTRLHKVKYGYSTPGKL